MDSYKLGSEGTENYGLRPMDVASDGSHVDNVKLRALNKRWNLLAGVVLLLAVLNITALGVAIWAGVTATDAKDDAQALMSQGTGTSAGAGVYVSTSPVPPEGYIFAGSVYRGSGYWSNTSSNLPSPRADFVAVPVGDSRVLVMGGQDGSGAFLDSVVAYDAVLDRYDSLDAMPEPRSHFAAAALGVDTVMVVGGYKDEASAAAATAEACPLIYTLSSNSWASDAPCMAAGVANACAAGIGGKVYVAGGSTGGRASGTIYAYDPSANSWTVAKSLPSARVDVACAALGDTLYVAGGRGDAGQLLAELVAFNTTSGVVSTLSPLPYGSGDVELIVLPNSRLLAIGGLLETSTSASSVQAALHYVQEYIPALDTWVQKAPIATSRLRAGAAYANGGVYAFGGMTTCTPDAADCSSWALADVEVFYDIDHPDVFLHLPNPAADSVPQPPEAQVVLSTSSSPLNGFSNAGLLHAGSGYWAQELDLPSGLSDFAAVPSGDLILIPGGTLEGGALSEDLWQFDALLSTYTKLAPMPEPRTRYGAAILEDKLYVAGGFNSSAGDAAPAEAMLVYDIPSGKWLDPQAGLITPRSDACMAAVDGKLYIAGGYDTGYENVLDSAEVFDPNDGTWTKLTRPMPTPRGDVMCASFQSKFVVMGGYYDATRQWLPSAFRTEVEAYDPSTADWTTLAPIPQARGDNALVQLPGDRMLVMGGETNTETRNQVATNQVDLYLAEYDLWVPMAPMPEPRFRFDAAFANGFVYVFGGQASALGLCAGQDGDCTYRTRASACKYLDVEYPDVFVYLATN